MKHNSETMYLERYAKELLEALFPDQYVELEHSESPDLRMGSDYGIEVTWAMFKGQGQANGILNHVKGQKLDEVDPRYKMAMERINAKLYDNAEGKVCGYVPNFGNCVSYGELFQAYNKKKCKREKYDTKTVDLFIYPPLAQLDGWLGKEVICEFFSAVYEDPSNPFNNIIVYEEPTLYLFNVASNCIKINRGSSGTIQHCKIEANEYSGWSASRRENRQEKEDVKEAKAAFKPTLFISYNHKNIITAEKIAEGSKEYADVIWDKELGPWKSFKEFMDSIRKRDFVALVISDEYLKSINCMYEVMQLMNEPNWKQKAMFVLEESAETIYSIMTQLHYVDYWENEENKLREEIGKHAQSAFSRLEEEINKYAEIKTRIIDFMKSLADSNNPSKEEAIDAIKNRMKIAAKRNNSETIERTILSLIKNGTNTVSELAIATNRTENNIRKHLNDLVNEGMLKIERTDNRKAYMTV